MDLMIKLNSQTQGKDKIARLLQYTSKAVWSSCDQKNSSNAEFINYIKLIENTLSSFRKLLRFGKGFEVLYASISSIRIEKIAQQILIFLSKISYGLYLLGDHLIWLSKAGLSKNVDVKKWGERSNKFWLITIIMNLCRDLLEFIRVYSYYYKTNYKNVQKEFSQEVAKSMALENKGLVLDTIKNGCDLVIPLSGLGYANINTTIVGICGMISSIAGLLPLIEPMYKF